MWLFFVVSQFCWAVHFGVAETFTRLRWRGKKKKHGVRLNVARSYLGPLRDAANACGPVHVATHRASDQTLEAKEKSLYQLSATTTTVVAENTQPTQTASVFPAVCDSVFGASRTRGLIIHD